MRYCRADEESLGHTWEIQSNVLVASSAEYALEATKWFLERFGWINPSIDVLQKDQQQFLRL